MQDAISKQMNLQNPTPYLNKTQGTSSTKHQVLRLQKVELGLAISHKPGFQFDRFN